VFRAPGARRAPPVGTRHRQCLYPCHDATYPRHRTNGFDYRQIVSPFAPGINESYFITSISMAF
jgi:hypothetical protein